MGREEVSEGIKDEVEGIRTSERISPINEGIFHSLFFVVDVL